MGQIKCQCCGKIFDEDELVVEEWDEDRGEYWGMPCTEHMIQWLCPYCDSDDVDEYYEDEDEEEEDE